MPTNAIPARTAASSLFQPRSVSGALLSLLSGFIRSEGLPHEYETTAAYCSRSPSNTDPSFVQSTSKPRRRAIPTKICSPSESVLPCRRITGCSKSTLRLKKEFAAALRVCSPMRGARQQPVPPAIAELCVVSSAACQRELALLLRRSHAHYFCCTAACQEQCFERNAIHPVQDSNHSPSFRARPVPCNRCYIDLARGLANANMYSILDHRPNRRGNSVVMGGM